MIKVKKTIQKIKRIPVPMKATFVFVVVTFLQKGLAMLTTPIFTRILSTEDYGITSVFNSWYSIISVVATLSLSSGVFNVGMLKFKEDRDGYISSMIGLSNVTTIIGGIITIFAIDNVVKLISIPSSLLILIFLNLLFLPATGFWLARQRYEYKYKLSATVMISSSILSVIISIVFVLCFDNRLAEIKLWSSASIPLLFAIIIYMVLLFKGKKIFVKKYWKFALLFNLPLIPHYLSFSILSGSDRVMIANMIGVREAGIYGLIYTAGTVGNIVWNSVNSSLIPYVHEKMEKKKYEDVNKASVTLLALYALLCCFIILVAPEILKILAPPEYYEGIYLFPSVMAGIFFSALYNLFGNIEFYYEKTFMVMTATFIAATSNVILNYIFIPRMGYISAAYTTLFSYIILATMHYFNLLRMQERKIFNIKAIILISTGVVLFSLLANILYMNNVIRWSFIIIGLIMILFNRKRIRSIIQLLKRK